MPYRTPTGSVYDSGEFAQAFDKTLRLADWDGFDARCAEARSRGRLRGRGISYYSAPSGREAHRHAGDAPPGMGSYSAGRGCLAQAQ